MGGFWNFFSLTSPFLYRLSSFSLEFEILETKGVQKFWVEKLGLEKIFKNLEIHKKKKVRKGGLSEGKNILFTPKKHTFLGGASELSKQL